MTTGPDAMILPRFNPEAVADFDAGHLFFASEG
jgi:hypothetical protein